MTIVLAAPTTLNFPADPSKFTFDKINYDNVKGMGNVGDSQNIDYKGFTCIMPVMKFLQVTPARSYDKNSNYEFLKEEIKKGTPIGCPFLVIDFTSMQPKVKSHEGRTRCKIISEIDPKTYMMVHIFPSGGDRARDLNTGAINRARHILVKEKSKELIKGNNFYKKVKWLGKIVNLEAGLQ